MARPAAPSARTAPVRTSLVRSSLVRSTLALGLVGLWMALLFAGHPAGGASHLLLLAALALYPWRAARPPGE